MSSDLVIRDEAAVQEAAVVAVAEVLRSCIDLAKDRQAWSAKLEALHSAYQKHGESELIVLETRRLETEVARMVISSLIQAGDTGGALVAFQEYMNKSPDVLSRAVQIIVGISGV